MAGENREFLNERDSRIYAMKQRGVPNVEIAKRLDISSAAVNAGLSRQLNRLQAEAITAVPQMVRMELERLDALQQAIWPMTQMRMVTIDGVQVPVEPDLKATAQVLSIMDRRMKILGLEQVTLNVNVEKDNVASTLHGTTKAIETSSHDPESEAKKLIQIMIEAGAFSSDELKMVMAVADPKVLEPPLKSLTEIEDELGIEDAEIVEG